MTVNKYFEMKLQKYKTENKDAVWKKVYDRGIRFNGKNIAPNFEVRNSLEHFSIRKKKERFQQKSDPVKFQQKMPQKACLKIWVSRIKFVK